MAATLVLRDTQLVAEATLVVVCNTFVLPATKPVALNRNLPAAMPALVRVIG